eukprot:s912_g2.t1
MKEVCDIYKFGKIEKDHFRYCGRDVKKDKDGIHITCPSLIDRVKPIYLTAEERKKKEQPVTEAHRQQLRSVVGSLAWLARTCRPDLSYAVSHLQSNVTQAKFKDIQYANIVISIAQKTKDVGITYPLKAFKFEDAVIIGMQDASFANDHELNEAGKRLGLRSQSGRLLCLGPPSFKDNKQGEMLLVSWHSVTIKRVCRSTLQAESMSLIAGLEESEHLRMVLHGLRKDHHRYDATWQTEAMDERNVELFTDCRSLEEAVNQQGLQTVGDKRLAIDLCGVRQQIWRRAGEATGDPLLTDHLPKNATTRLWWTNTEKMAADALTKSMKPKSLGAVMQGRWIDLNPEKKNQHGLAVVAAALVASVQVDEIGMAAAISICERGHVWQQSLTLLDLMSRWSTMSLIANNALLAAYEKVDDWRSSLGSLVRMSSQRLAMDEVTMNSCASACEKSNFWRTALQLLGEPVDLIGYNLLLRSCMHASDWQRAKLGWRMPKINALLDQLQRHCFGSSSSHPVVTHQKVTSRQCGFCSLECFWRSLRHWRSVFFAVTSRKATTRHQRFEENLRKRRRPKPGQRPRSSGDRSPGQRLQLQSQDILFSLTSSTRTTGVFSFCA